MEDEVKDGGAAFPHAGFETYNSEAGYWQPTNPVSGMSLRDWFAGQALAGFAGISGAMGPGQHEMNAQLAYQQADAMLAAREVKP